MASNILDRVLESQERTHKETFNPIELTSQFLKLLGDREQEILARRYGLLKEKSETLEEIGKSYGLTRERIRQLENSAVNRIKGHENFEQNIMPAQDLTFNLLERHGGIMEHSHLASMLLPQGSALEEHDPHISFILYRLIDHRVERFMQKEEIVPSWKIKDMDISPILSLAEKIIQLLNKINEPAEEKELLDRILSANPESTVNNVESAMRISSKIKKNIFGRWGLVSWPQITPRRMSDKIYLALREIGKPLHFAQIADSINQYNFDRKKAHIPTVHNELILDPRFVLVGRGMYALKEWGYRDGIVKELIAAILNEKGPIAKDEILELVRPQRMVKDATIMLALSDKSRFAKDSEGKYKTIV